MSAANQQSTAPGQKASGKPRRDRPWSAKSPRDHLGYRPGSVYLHQTGPRRSLAERAWSDVPTEEELRRRQEEQERQEREREEKEEKEERERQERQECERQLEREREEKEEEKRQRNQHRTHETSPQETIDKEDDDDACEPLTSAVEETGPDATMAMPLDDGIERSEDCAVPSQDHGEAKKDAAMGSHSHHGSRRASSSRNAADEHNILEVSSSSAASTPENKKDRRRASDAEVFGQGPASNQYPASVSESGKRKHRRGSLRSRRQRPDSASSQRSVSSKSRDCHSDHGALHDGAHDANEDFEDERNSGRGSTARCSSHSRASPSRRTETASKGSRRSRSRRSSARALFDDRNDRSSTPSSTDSDNIGDVRRDDRRRRTPHRSASPSSSTRHKRPDHHQHQEIDQHQQQKGRGSSPASSSAQHTHHGRAPRHMSRRHGSFASSVGIPGHTSTTSTPTPHGHGSPGVGDGSSGVGAGRAGAAGGLSVANRPRPFSAGAQRTPHHGGSRHGGGDTHAASAHPYDLPTRDGGAGGVAGRGRSRYASSRNLPVGSPTSLLSVAGSTRSVRSDFTNGDDGGRGFDEETELRGPSSRAEMESRARRSKRQHQTQTSTSASESSAVYRARAPAAAAAPGHSAAFRIATAGSPTKGDLSRSSIDASGHPGASNDERNTNSEDRNGRDGDPTVVVEDHSAELLGHRGAPDSRSNPAGLSAPSTGPLGPLSGSPWDTPKPRSRQGTPQGGTPRSTPDASATLVPGPALQQDERDGKNEEEEDEASFKIEEEAINGREETPDRAPTPDLSPGGRGTEESADKITKSTDAQSDVAGHSLPPTLSESDRPAPFGSIPNAKKNDGRNVRAPPLARSGAERVDVEDEDEDTLGVEQPTDEGRSPVLDTCRDFTAPSSTRPDARSRSTGVPQPSTNADVPPTVGVQEAHASHASVLRASTESALGRRSLSPRPTAGSSSAMGPSRVMAYDRNGAQEISASAKSSRKSSPLPRPVNSSSRLSPRHAGSTHGGAQDGSRSQDGYESSTQQSRKVSPVQSHGSHHRPGERYRRRRSSSVASSIAGDLTMEVLASYQRRAHQRSIAERDESRLMAAADASRSSSVRGNTQNDMSSDPELRDHSRSGGQLPGSASVGPDEVVSAIGRELGRRDSAKSLSRRSSVVNASVTSDRGGGLFLSPNSYASVDPVGNSSHNTSAGAARSTPVPAPPQQHYSSGGVSGGHGGGGGGVVRATPRSSPRATPRATPRAIDVLDVVPATAPQDIARQQDELAEMVVQEVEEAVAHSRL